MRGEGRKRENRKGEKTRMNKSINRWRMQDKEAKKRRRKKQAQRPFLKSQDLAATPDDVTIEDQPHFPEPECWQKKGDWCESPVYVRMHVCLYCMCVRVCVLMMKRFPAGLGFGKGDECKNQEEGAKSDGIGRWAIFVESRDGRRKDRCQRNGRWTRWIFFGFDFFLARSEEEKKRKKKRGEERETQSRESVSQCPEVGENFFPSVLASGNGQHRN